LIIVPCGIYFFLKKDFNTKISTVTMNTTVINGAITPANALLLALFLSHPPVQAAPPAGQLHV
jgi:hypothetical protein